jgi:thymidine kinase
MDSTKPFRVVKVKTFYGPMFSGKTTNMVAEVERFAIAKHSCVIIKHSRDVRFNHLASSGGIVTHRGDEKCRIPIIEAEKLADIEHLVHEYEVVGVDEAQFYPDGPEYINKWALSGKQIVTACLNSDFMARPIVRSAEIIIMSNEAIKLDAVCMVCSDDAPFTRRLTSSTDVEVIGGKDIYQAVCRKCMFSTPN